MPLYNYRCQACDHSFETLVRGSDVPVCPQCGATTLEKLVSRPAPDGKSSTFIANARTVAASQGHFSNYGRSERPKMKR